MMSHFHDQFVRDLAEDGALRRLLARRFGTTGLDTANQLAIVVESLPPCRHDHFVEATRSVCQSERHELVERWASVRYYTVPMDFDICVHEIPLGAGALMVEADACPTKRSRASDFMGAPEPLRSAIEVMDIGFPEAFTEAGVRCLMEAVLRTREDVPEARAKFSSVVGDSFADGLAREINAVLRDHFRREQLLRSGSGALSDAFKTGSSDAGWSVALDLAVGSLSPVVGGIRAAAVAHREGAKLRRQAPWKVACEYLRHAHGKGILAMLNGREGDRDNTQDDLA